MIISTIRRRVLPSLVRLRNASSASSAVISSPELVDLETRWEQMPVEAQEKLFNKMEDRQKSDWHELTLQEKRAGLTKKIAYYMSFGDYGPRKPDPTKTSHVVLGVIGVKSLSGGEVPRTMTREWQEASNEAMKKQKIEPITGISSEGYTGKGMVQSK
ncbi:Cytochrome c oxidase polypeptide 5, mitochondrial [Neolecta irregularis DAH-3]|uniref:Cytochrome c oxidase polypeptide 5, mitochondrial n=1 Tax=Neolecta irregularis (strain DAH-3) TaxID=1198029 RepID=A0A1U7LU67_NEOID|nr:Cytochrome c oxidase polypeptide 5, mitochondrial [Neolecta irregularis DAH-3]|eukprot:OLL26061.1 Cytochrome c oxidase polypeptide 5, mitochondrial [Neolecta irregularis DAH-3]